MYFMNEIILSEKYHNSISIDRYYYTRERERE